MIEVRSGVNGTSRKKFSYPPILSFSHRLAVGAIPARVLSHGLQQAVHGYGLFWFHSFFAPAWPIELYHFSMATETRSPSMLMLRGRVGRRVGRQVGQNVGEV
jgi:hypothetical protein